MKPFLKWCGGKARLLPELKARVPTKYGRYFEPFAGGAALFFGLDPTQATLGDTNAALIEMYIAVACHTEGVLERLEVLKKSHDALGDTLYYEMRKKWNDNAWSSCVKSRAAAFIYLNKTCFNGLWRVNREGKMNVPVGRYKNPGIYDSERIRASAALLRRAELKVGDYKTTTCEAQRGDFVYFDPPYDPIDKTSNFTSYTKDKFGDAEQAALAEHATKLRDAGVHVMLSNNDTPMIRKLYRGYKFETVRCARAINSDATKRGEINEALITGAP